jgi:hypothetical protein
MQITGSCMAELIKSQKGVLRSVCMQKRRRSAHASSLASGVGRGSSARKAQRQAPAPPKCERARAVPGPLHAPAAGVRASGIGHCCVWGRVDTSCRASHNALLQSATWARCAAAGEAVAGVWGGKRGASGAGVGKSGAACPMSSTAMKSVQEQF